MFLAIISHINLSILLEASPTEFIGSLLFIRLIILAFVILIGFIIYTGVRSNKKIILIHSLKNDALKPAVIFTGIIILIEVMYKMYPNWDTSLPFNYWELSYFIIGSLCLIFLIFVKKTQFNTILSIFNVLWIICMPITFYSEAGNFIVYHIIYEFVPILLVFVIISFVELNHLKTAENKDELKFWQSYISALATADTITAFNTDDYNNFLDPLGFRYFAEQIKEISIRPYVDLKIRDANDSEVNVSNNVFESKCRIFIIENELTTECPEIKAITGHSKLADYQRNFKAVYLVHKSLRIQMFLVPRKVLKKHIEENWKFKWYECFFLKKHKISKLIVKMDKIKLNNRIYSPSEKKGSLSFDESQDDKLNTLVNSAISAFRVDKYNINDKLNNEDLKIT